MQSYGISSEEALARVDSLTDQEIALIAGKLDQLPAGGAATLGAALIAVTWPYILAAGIIIAVIFIIIDYAWDEELDLAK